MKRLGETYEKQPLWTSTKFRDKEGEVGHVRIEKNAEHFIRRDERKYVVSEDWTAHMKSGHAYTDTVDTRYTNDYGKAVAVAQKWTSNLHKMKSIKPVEGKSLVRIPARASLNGVGR